ncbi:MAG: InlB B-repeat-containing protein [Oscillospiraceae bacterium]|nr:InlB B-repeat-containing protein [Oscillospiraceae bacterium]
MNIKLFFSTIFILGILFLGCDTDNESGTKTYTVTFNSNGGSDVVTISGITSGSTITLPENPTKQDNDFVGWFIDNGTFQNQFTSSTVITQNLTVFAKWLPKNSEQKSITITDFIDSYTGEWQVWLLPSTTITVMTDIVAVLRATPAGGIISGNLLDMASGNGGQPISNWTGSGDYYVYLIPRQPNDHPYPGTSRYLSKTKVTFNKAVTTYSFTGNFTVTKIEP